MAKKKGLWVYRAHDEDGFPVAEDYDKRKLLDKLAAGDYWGGQKLTIDRVFIEGLE